VLDDPEFAPEHRGQICSRKSSIDSQLRFLIWDIDGRLTTECAAPIRSCGEPPFRRYSFTSAPAGTSRERSTSLREARSQSIKMNARSSLSSSRT
jgi:hypothetical protein